MVIAACALWVSLQFSFNPAAMVASPCIATQRPEVRKELKLSKEQIKVLDEVKKRFTEATQAANKSMDFSAISQAMREGDARIWEALDDGQDERLRGLILQIKGPAAFGEEEFVKEYALTPEQVEKLDAIRTTCRDGYMNAARKDQRKLKGILETYEKDSLAVLTADQRAKYDRACGPKVKNLSMGLPPF